MFTNMGIGLFVVVVLSLLYDVYEKYGVIEIFEIFGITIAFLIVIYYIGYVVRWLYGKVFD